MMLQKTKKKKPVKLKEGFDNRFFVICPKCGTYVYEHQMLYTEGKKFVFKVHCFKCGNSFDNIMQDVESKQKEMFNNMLKKAMGMIDKESIEMLRNEFDKKMNKDKEDDNV